jgi:hypothetical protein
MAAGARPPVDRNSSKNFVTIALLRTSRLRAPLLDFAGWRECSFTPEWLGVFSVGIGPWEADVFQVLVVEFGEIATRKGASAPRPGGLAQPEESRAKKISQPVHKTGIDGRVGFERFCRHDS